MPWGVPRLPQLKTEDAPLAKSLFMELSCYKSFQTMHLANHTALKQVSRKEGDWKKQASMKTKIIKLILIYCVIDLLLITTGLASCILDYYKIGWT